MRLAVYTYNSEPFLWYPTSRISFVNFSHKKPVAGSKWKTIDPGFDCIKTPMERLPGFDVWLWVDPRINELTINFDEFLFQIESLNPNFIYGIGQSQNGFKTIATGCAMEPSDVERSKDLLEFVYKTVLPDNRKYSTQIPLLTFSSILFFNSPKIQNTFSDAVDMMVKFQGLNPQVAMNWCAWKNTVKIEPIEDIQIEMVHHKIWIKPSVPPNKPTVQPLISPLSPSQSGKTEPVPSSMHSREAVTVNESIQSTEDVLRTKSGLIIPRNISQSEIENLIQTGQIDNSVLSKLTLETFGRTIPLLPNIDNALPDVSVMMTTWNRTALAVKCLRGLVENIDYPMEKLWWVLADDGSEPGHVEACIDALTQSGVSIDRIFTTRNYRTGKNARFGHPINLNNGMREAFKHSEIVLRTEDDLLAVQKIPIREYAKILRDNKNVGGIKLGHGADANRKLPWKKDPKRFQIDASYWNPYIFNHLVMICHKRVYDDLGMYNEELSGGQVEADIGKRFMNKYRNRTLDSEYRMNILIPTIKPVKTSAGGQIPWLYFIHLGKESVSGHTHKDNWNPETVKLNSEEAAETVRTAASLV